jgi:hypothetical protein
MKAQGSLYLTFNILLYHNFSLFAFFLNQFLINMDSSDRSNNISEMPNLMWSKILGSVIAVITLVLPLLVIASNSSGYLVDNLAPVNYKQTIQRK